MLTPSDQTARLSHISPRFGGGFFVALSDAWPGRSRTCASLNRSLINKCLLNLEKQQRKLVKLKEKAELCVSRDQAQAIIRKAEKAQRKIQRAQTEA